MTNTSSPNAAADIPNTRSSPKATDIPPTRTHQPGKTVTWTQEDQEERKTVTWAQENQEENDLITRALHLFDLSAQTMQLFDDASSRYLNFKKAGTIPPLIHCSPSEFWADIDQYETNNNHETSKQQSEKDQYETNTNHEASKQQSDNDQYETNNNHEALKQQPDSTPVNEGLKEKPDCIAVKKSVDKRSDHQRKKIVPWTEEEHMRFLWGLEKYSKGDWKSISRNCVLTRNSIQVASHAQKYYKRLQLADKDKKRTSIHDTKIQNLPDHSSLMHSQPSVYSMQSTPPPPPPPPPIMLDQTSGFFHWNHHNATAGVYRPSEPPCYGVSPLPHLH